ncbi:MAG: hypothetical protein KatS3mg031_2898 [Chitinophagales bacterium]|nr:MAG: hypothetical protein KatS3mg031_2898 [Chitinophagales bacterium]
MRVRQKTAAAAKSLMDALGITQVELSALTGIKQPQISFILNNPSGDEMRNAKAVLSNALERLAYIAYPLRREQEAREQYSNLCKFFALHGEYRNNIDGRLLEIYFAMRGAVKPYFMLLENECRVGFLFTCNVFDIDNDLPF